MRVQESKIAKTEASCWPGSVRAERYDSESNRVFYRGILARLLDQVPSLAGRGLDLGCGSGFSTQFLIETAPHVTWSGVDCSREMVQLARRKPGLGEADLRVARAEALPFADGSFDTVVANFSWHWFGDEARHEIRRVLRPRGWLLASVPLRRFSSAPGNRALARALLAGRRHYAARASQGLRFEDVPRLLPGKVHVTRHELVVVHERFVDGRELCEVLASRGALAAIFGEQVPTVIAAPAPVDFEWPFAVLHAQV
jgi:SAM-dependent methyltransferase